MIFYVFSSEITEMLRKHQKFPYGSSSNRDFSMLEVKTTLRRPAGAGADFLYTLLTTIGDRAHGYGRRPFYQVKSPKFVKSRNVQKTQGTLIVCTNPALRRTFAHARVQPPGRFRSCTAPTPTIMQPDFQRKSSPTYAN